MGVVSNIVVRRCFRSRPHKNFLAYIMFGAFSACALCSGFPDGFIFPRLRFLFVPPSCSLPAVEDSVGHGGGVVLQGFAGGFFAGQRV